MSVVRVVRPGDIDEVPPTAPTNLVLTQIDATTIGVEYDAGTDENGISHHLTHFNGDVPSASGVTLVAGPQPYVVSLEDVTSDVEHTITVYAVDKAGNRSEGTSAAITLTSSGGTAFFSDDFESYDVGTNPTGDGTFDWSAGTDGGTVSDDRAFSGTKSLKFAHGGFGGNDNKEHSFTFGPGVKHQRVRIRRRIWIPSDFWLRDNRSGEGGPWPDVSMSNGSATLTGPASTFIAEDLGLFITVPGAGAGGADLDSVIVDVVSDTEVTLHVAASTTVSGVEATHNAGGLNNNKFLALFGRHYSGDNRVKIIVEIREASIVGDARFRFLVNPNGGPTSFNIGSTQVGGTTTYIPAIADTGDTMRRGQWNDWEYYVDAGTGPGEGVVQCRINGVLVFNETGLNIYPTGGTDPQETKFGADTGRCGYLWGAPGESYYKPFDFYEDDIEFSSTDPGW